MSYGNFIENFKKEKIPGQWVMREKKTMDHTNQPQEDSQVLEYLDELVETFNEELQKDIETPDFYQAFAKLEEIELIQGAMLNEKPHYEH